MKLSKSLEVEIVPDEDIPPKGHSDDSHEEGVEVPLDRIKPDILRNLIAEFVTREWEELGDCRYTLDDKIDQVLRQLKERKAKIVFDLNTNTCNIVPCEGKNNL
jgi:uncharacterized protein YheU (UPF0270 family)